MNFFCRCSKHDLGAAQKPPLDSSVVKVEHYFIIVNIVCFTGVRFIAIQTLTNLGHLLSLPFLLCVAQFLFLFRYSRVLTKIMFSLFYGPDILSPPFPPFRLQLEC